MQNFEQILSTDQDVQEQSTFQNKLAQTIVLEKAQSYFTSMLLFQYVNNEETFYSRYQENQ